MYADEAELSRESHRPVVRSPARLAHDLLELRHPGDDVLRGRTSPNPTVAVRTVDTTKTETNQSNPSPHISRTFDASAAFPVEISVPWPEFFMLELFARSMSFAAIALHLAILRILTADHAQLRHGTHRTRPERLIPVLSRQP